MIFGAPKRRFGDVGGRRSSNQVDLSEEDDVPIKQRKMSAEEKALEDELVAGYQEALRGLFDENDNFLGEAAKIPLIPWNSKKKKPFYLSKCDRDISVAAILGAIGITRWTSKASLQRFLTCVRNIEHRIFKRAVDILDYYDQLEWTIADAHFRYCRRGASLIESRMELVQIHTERGRGAPRRKPFSVLHNNN